MYTIVSEKTNESNNVRNNDVCHLRRQQKGEEQIMNQILKSALQATGAIFAMTVVVTLCEIYIGNAFWFVPEYGQEAYGQISDVPSKEQLDSMGTSALHVADMLQDTVSTSEKCTSDITSYDFSTFQECSNFVKSFEKHMMQTLNETSADMVTIRGY